MSKQVNTPWGRIYPGELLLIVITGIIILSMALLANSLTQYFTAIVAALAGAFNLYVLSKSGGGYDFVSPLLWAASAIVIVLMILIYVTTLF